jgi:thiol:disulfide interchange protein DsbD
VALETDAVRQEMAKLGVVPLRADFTGPDPLISAWLDRHQRAGVPMYVVIPADRGRDVWLLPEILTPGLVVDALRDAARRPQADGGGR